MTCKKSIPKLLWVIIIGLYASLMVQSQDSVPAPLCLIDKPTLYIPRLELLSPIEMAPLCSELRTWDVSHVFGHVAHLQYTPWFAEGGNTVVVGHSLNFEGERDVFYRLSTLEVGDWIHVYLSDEHVLTYQVSQKLEVDKRELSILQSHGTSELTLFTCTPQSFDAETGTYQRRTVVVAQLVS